MKCFKSIIGCLLIFFSVSTSAQLTPNDMLEDLAQLEDLIESRHVRPYRLISKEAFQKILSDAGTSIKSRSSCDETCYIEILKVVAALRDGHSIVRSSSREKLFGYLPFTVTWFKEGLFLTRTTEEHANLLGARLVGINDVPIEEVLQAIKKVLPHGNDARFQKFAYTYLRLPGLLHGLGISNDPKKAKLCFTKNGKKKLIELSNMSDEEYEKTVFVEYDQVNDKIPIYRKNAEDYYWYTYDADHRIFYCNYSRVGNMEKERASTFASRMFAMLDSLEVEKFVFDIRDNGGGNFGYSMSFVQGILDHPKINAPDKLFVISGYNTFSAALDVLRVLEQRSFAIIIGVPPGDYAASSGDPETYTLKNSGIEVQLSSRFHPTVFKNDMRPEILLDHRIENSWEAYREGKDLAFDYVINFEDRKKQLVKATNFESYLRRYNYDEDRHLIVKDLNNNLFLEISKTLSSPLYKYKDSLFKTEIQGLMLSFENNQVKMHFPDGTSASFSTAATEKTGLDLLYEGDIENARIFYQQIKLQDPNNLKITDGRFSSLALFAFFELRKDGTKEAAQIARSILNLGIELNEGKAPNCEFALRFY